MGSMGAAKNPLTRQLTRRSARAYPSTQSTSGAMNNAQTMAIPAGAATEWAVAGPAVTRAAVIQVVVIPAAVTRAAAGEPRAFLKPTEEESWRRLRRALVGSTLKPKNQPISWRFTAEPVRMF